MKIKFSDGIFTLVDAGGVTLKSVTITHDEMESMSGGRLHYVPGRQRTTIEVVHADGKEETIENVEQARDEFQRDVK